MTGNEGNATGNPPPTPRGVAWIDAATAAARMNVSEQRLRQRCAGEWSAAGLAEKRRPASGGKSSWHVREDADAALSAVKFADQMSIDLARLTDAQRQQILRDWGMAR